MPSRITFGTSGARGVTNAQITPAHALAAGARLVYCRIGQPDTDRAVIEHKARFASEPAAKYWFGDAWNWYDGPYAVAKMLEIMSMRQMTLDQLAAELPPYYQASANIALDDERKAQVQGARSNRKRGRESFFSHF